MNGERHDNAEKVEKSDKATFSLHIQSKQKLNFKPSQRNRQKFGQLLF